MSSQNRVLKEGFLEKRSNGLLQLWKKKRCLLTDDGLRLYDWKRSGSDSSAKAKELRFERMATVDCVEYKRGLVYFTVVMAGGQEIDFRCQQEGTPWNAEIALSLVRFKNLLAVQSGRTRHLAHLGSTGEEEAPDL
ncbi:pleckstrin homology-like domain family A member 3 [Erpetoichthys calabaricus]|uniref:Pleckstrin homology-like domain, family A, member 3 n=1 Tax=Erpetoichthys calabaricus TaxID=27687 RepID=A0A8C4RKY2_ERPCA|nr:pleckstrin homology-like domain family A member 3 [Erpetoichthys calabaricus]